MQTSFTYYSSFKGLSITSVYRIFGKLWNWLSPQTKISWRVNGASSPPFSPNSTEHSSSGLKIAVVIPFFAYVWAKNALLQQHNSWWTLRHGIWLLKLWWAPHRSSPFLFPQKYIRSWQISPKGFFFMERGPATEPLSVRLRYLDPLWNEITNCFNKLVSKFVMVALENAIGPCGKDREGECHPKEFVNCKNHISNFCITGMCFSNQWCLQTSHEEVKARFMCKSWAYTRCWEIFSWKVFCTSTSLFAS